MTGIVVGSTSSALAISVRQEYLYLDDPRIGVVYGSTANQAAKVQAAWDMAAAAAGGAVFAGGKLRAGNTPLIWPSQGSGRGSFRMLGAGSGAEWSESPAGIWWDTDDAGAAPAPGDYAGTVGGIRVPSDALAVRIEKITLQGPGDSPVIGTMPAKMYGLMMPTRCVLEDVTITRWGAAVGIINDHQRYINCDFRGNGYAIDLMDNPLGGIGDMLWAECAMDAQTRAGIALSDSNALTNTRFEGNGHIGASPIGIYRYAGQAGVARDGQAMQGVVFENISFEYCGNAWIYDEAGGGSFSNITFDSPAEFATGGSAKWPGKPWPMAKIHIGSGAGFHWREGPIIPQADNPDQPVISAQDFTRFTVDDPLPLFDAVSVYGHKSFVRRTGGNGSKYAGGRIGVADSPDGLALGAMEASEAIAKGSLVEMVGTNQVRESRNGLSSQIVGVSVIDYSLGDVCVYVTAGARSGLVVRNGTGGTLTNGALLTPDSAHQGCVKAATSLNDLIVGRAHDGSITGTTGPIMVSL